MAKASVLSIQASESKEIKSEAVASKDEITEKSFNMNTPRTIPLKSEIMTFFEYSAKNIANKEGTRERAESSIRTPLKLYGKQYQTNPAKLLFIEFTLFFFNFFKTKLFIIKQCFQRTYFYYGLTQSVTFETSI